MLMLRDHEIMLTLGGLRARLTEETVGLRSHCNPPFLTSGWHCLGVFFGGRLPSARFKQLVKGVRKCVYYFLNERTMK